jgi:flagellar hook-basal body complex protein FliE
MSTIEAVEFIAPTSPVSLATRATELAAAPDVAGTQSRFSTWFTQQLDRVNGDLDNADRQLQALAAGESQNLHQVMMSLEEARLSFQLALQVRNRVLEAYQEVMRMQV